mgnify:FL=1
MTIDNQYDALVESLVLAITAQTEEQQTKIAGIPDQIAAGMDEVTVERAKKEALERINGEVE